MKFYESPIFLNFFLLFVNISLFTSKLIFSFLTNSIALQADAFDNLTDIVMVVAALIGIIYSRKKPSEKFPYGYYKIENIISLIFSIFIFYTAYNIILNSIRDFIDFFSGDLKVITISPLILIFLVIAFTITLFSSYYLKIIGKKTRSPIIESEASEKFLDIFISLSVLVGFVGIYFNLYLLDSIIGLFITLFIIKGGYNIFLNSTKTLLDAVIDFDKRTELNKLIESFPKIKKIESLEVRSYGKYVFLEVVVSLNKDLSLVQVQTLKNLIITKIKEKFPQIFKVIMLTQTQEKPITKVAVSLLDNNGLNSKISDHFGESKFFAIFEIQKEENKDSLQNYNIIKNKYTHLEKRKGINLADWLISEKIDKIYLKKELKKGPKLFFENSLVQVIIIELNYLQEIINLETKS